MSGYDNNGHLHGRDGKYQPQLLDEPVGITGMGGPEPLVDALRADGFPLGVIEVSGPGHVVYTDPTDGHTYDVQTLDNSIHAGSDDTDAAFYSYRFAGDDGPKAPGDALRSVVGQAREIRAMSAALDEWLGRIRDDRGLAWVEPQPDRARGSLSGGGITIGGFALDGEFGSPEMTVTVHDEGLAGDTEFRLYRMRNGDLSVIRDDARRPCARWEVDALDAYVTGIVGGPGTAQSLNGLFASAIEKAKKPGAGLYA